MATTKRGKDRGRDKKGAEPRKQLEERRFLPTLSGPTWPVFGVGAAGALAAGFGVYARFVAVPPYSWALWALVLGVGVLVAALLLGESASPVRVGDAGVAIEKGNELVRVAWAELEKVELRSSQLGGPQLMLDTREVKMGIPVSAHRLAVAWILSEGTRRMPEVMNVKASVLDSLPRPDDNDGERLRIEDLQLAGKACKKSGKPIRYERDARLCPNCAELYHRESVPKTCVTCEQPLGSNAMEL